MSKLKVFVACPYSIFPLDDYKKVFESVGRTYNVSFDFADEKVTNQHVLTKITNYIRDADISLFDITGWNPNVALELGIAVGLARRYFILLNTKVESKEVPSDIKGIDRIQYASNSELEAKLIFLIRQELPDTRGKSESAFEALKEAIVEALRLNPGLNMTKLTDEIGQEKKLVQSTVYALVNANELKTRGQKKGTTYFTKDTDLRTISRK